MTHKAQNIYFLALYRQFANPYLIASPFKDGETEALEVWVSCSGSRC